MPDNPTKPPKKKNIRRRRKSRLSDEIDPAPRVLRLVASCLRGPSERGMFQDTPATRLDWCARILEGGRLPSQLMNSKKKCYDVAKREKRVAICRKGVDEHVDIANATLLPPKVEGKQVKLSREDQRAIEQLKELGMWEEDAPSPESGS